ncbi:MAG: hypothetical protein HY348_08025 [Nitrospira defluvii]|nr:hypothetical protein [Nitrospira defluvii]
MLHAVDLGAASLDGLFEHPADALHGVSNSHMFVPSGASKWFFNSLLVAYLHNLGQVSNRFEKSESRDQPAVA